MQMRGCSSHSFGDGGGYHVKQSVNRWSGTGRWSRIALAAVLTGALGLAACQQGRKGPLDPPPGTPGAAGLASDTTHSPSPFQSPFLGQENYGVPPGSTAPPPTTAAAPATAAPAAVPPQKKTFFLDFLLAK
jgi:hypothetical protein